MKIYQTSLDFSQGKKTIYGCSDITPLSIIHETGYNSILYYLNDEARDQEYRLNIRWYSAGQEIDLYNAKFITSFIPHGFSVRYFFFWN